MLYPLSYGGGAGAIWWKNTRRRTAQDRATRASRPAIDVLILCEGIEATPGRTRLAL